ncbi:MAG: T9SS type A sorting domain-containing protein, partial [Flavobacteriales bacterium]|nr:T9SS type A sorting domain-containing protein [Flavobacteriales bacterium]
DIYLYYKTNNRPQENTYTIRNLWGDVVWSRSNLPANTTYFDTLSLDPGCYVLELFDSNNDGFSYWADPGQGSGQFRIRQVGGGTLKNFEPEFGRRVLWAFAIGDIVGVEELSGTFGLNAYPNPTTGQFTLRTGEVHGDGDLQVLDARGNLVQARSLGLYGENRLDLDLGDAAPGLYLVRLTCEGRTAEVRVVKE